MTDPTPGRVAVAVAIIQALTAKVRALRLAHPADPERETAA